MDGTKRTALILAGGAGTRLWPLSTPDTPKQFLEIFEGRSLLQRTWDRMTRLVGDPAIWVATTESYRERVLEQLPDLPHSHLLLEPSRRNTAPAIATSCARIRETEGDTTVGIFPSDHAIGDEDAFDALARKAWDFAATGSHLVTIGIEPDTPNCNYGYLEVGESLAPDVRSVLRFVEKPDLETATGYVRSGRFLWNAGMFVWRTDTFFRTLRAVSPGLAADIEAWSSAPAGNRPAVYESMESLSIDYALMEHARNVATVPGSFGWSDIGSWRALTRFTSDAPTSRSLRSEGSRILSSSGRPVLVVGLPGVVVVETERGILVLNPEDDAGLPDLVRTIESDDKAGR